jgi:hypothetical protein
LATEGLEPEPAISAGPAPARRSGFLLGGIAKVGSTREGRLVLVLRTNEGEIELHGTSWTRVFDGDDVLPLGDLWGFVGTDVVIAWGREGRVHMIESVAIQ